MGQIATVIGKPHPKSLNIAVPGHRLYPINSTVVYVDDPFIHRRRAAACAPGNVQVPAALALS
jgi:hypothetical protein